MVKEYIERGHAVDAVLDVYCDTPDIDLSCEKFEAAILKIPAADVATVRHGQWIIDSAGGKIACSDCGCIYLGYNGRLPPNYCPNCGADMRGSNNE